MSLQAQIRATVGSFDLDVDLTIAPGELVALLGPNGAGKTSVLRALAGLLPIDAGHIALDGLVLDEPAIAIRLPVEQRPIGMVFQDYLLFPHLSVLENVAFGLRSRGVGRAAATARALSWLDRVGLGPEANRKPGSLSGGRRSALRWSGHWRPTRRFCSSTNRWRHWMSAPGSSYAESCDSTWSRSVGCGCW